MATRLYTDFSDAQGQLTPLSVVGSGQNSNSFNLLCMSSFPTSMNKIQSKMRAPHFSHYESMGIFPGAQGQLTPQLVDPAEFRTHVRFYGCPCYIQE